MKLFDRIYHGRTYRDRGYLFYLPILIAIVLSLFGYLSQDARIRARIDQQDIELMIRQSSIGVTPAVRAQCTWSSAIGLLRSDEMDLPGTVNAHMTDDEIDLGIWGDIRYHVGIVGYPIDDHEMWVIGPGWDEAACALVDRVRAIQARKEQP